MGKRKGIRPITRGTAALMAVMAVLQLRTAAGAPGDIFTIPAPVIGSDPPKATDIKDGDASVSTQTGALQYSYPIQVPPGRNGMAPQLALSYSSQAPTYGGIAAGWSLSVPIISEDLSQGRMKTRSNLGDLAQAISGQDPKVDDRFVSSMAGGRPLMMVAEPTGSLDDVYATYRAQNDTTFTRYERMHSTAPYRWRARTTDGKVMTFGEASRMAGCYVSEQYAPLTGMIDQFGNEVRYEYNQSVPDECNLVRIVWGQNVPKDPLADFAQVELSWKFGHICNGVYSNSQSDYRSGTRIQTGGGRLVSITATAYPPGGGAPVHTRDIQLDYDDEIERCNQQHAPVRLLRSIRESASGVDSPAVTLPPVTFEYNSPVTRLASQKTYPTPWYDGMSDRPNLGWGYRGSLYKWPTVESMFIDVDGDGLLDLLENDSTTPATSCVARWRKGTIDQNGDYKFTSPPQATIPLPRLKWRGSASPWPPGGAAQADPANPHFEGCSLNGQATAFRNSFATTLCHEPAGASCRAATDSSDRNKYCGTGGTVCPPDDGGPHTPNTDEFVTQLAYRWLDVDSDGLVDLVAAVHGDVDSYDIERGNKFATQTTPAYNGGEPSMSGIPGLGEWPACPGQVDRFANLDTCLEAVSARTCDGPGCIVNWASVLSCVTAATTMGSAVVFMKPPSGPENAPPPGDKHVAYERCEGLYPWFIYKNRGQGVFETTPIIKYQPVALESTNGDSSISNALSITSQDHTITDFDGDGYLDAVIRETDEAGGFYTGSLAWQIWFGDGTGGFTPKRYFFLTRSMTPCNGAFGCLGENAISGTGGAWGNQTVSLAGLIDANGDGAQDHWLAVPIAANANVANIAFNDGEQHKFVSSQPDIGEVTTSSVFGFRVKPGNDSWVFSTNPPCQPGQTNPPCPVPGKPIHAGTTTAQTRVADIDGDGRVDIVSFPAAAATPRVFFNVGGNFSTPGVDYPSPGAVGIRREAEALLGEPGDEVWRLNNDLMDLDGDGIQESVSFNGSNLVWVRPQDKQPPRLLRAVHNGSGLHTAITYAQMHDTSTVEQHADLDWPDGRPKASPRAQWVVKSLQVHDDISSTDGTTQYYYKNPRHGAADDGRYSFRGFEEVTTTAPGPTGTANGSQTVQTYGYDVDWSGRLVKTVVKASAAEGGAARTIDTTSWQPLTLFDGLITTYHTNISKHYVCSNGQTDTACMSTPAGYTQSTSTWTEYPNEPQLWVESGSVLQAGTSAADGDRQTLKSYLLRSTQDDYQLFETDTERRHRLAGVMVPFSKTRKTWDMTKKTQLTDEVWVDMVDDHRAITRYEYDKLGHLLAVWKPVQWAANPDPFTNLNRTTYQYDDRGFVAVETNELGHEREFTYEYGTGTKLTTRGPNETCKLLSCPRPVWPREEHTIRVDGMGRMIERYETFANNDLAFLLHLVETNTYVDGPYPSVTHQSAIDLNESTQQIRYTRDKTELDGHGRPTRKTVYFFISSGPEEQITTYQYTNDGSLGTVTLPDPADPTEHSSATVKYTYTFDSLGRPTSIRRPDSTAPASQSGVNMSYDGLTTTSTEVVGAAGGKAATTVTRNDAFGRLVEVREKRTSSAWATTTYAFDPNDNVKQVTDPQGGITALTHDYASQRTAITRAGRTWRYGYDKNGNMTSEQAPCKPVGSCEASYTTTIAYDALDRPSSKMLAPRALSSADRALFGASSELFTYDTATNGIGRLASWESFGPGAVEPTLSNTWDYNLQGQALSTYETTNAAGYTNLSRDVTTLFNLAGNPVATYHRDVVGTTNCQDGSLSSFGYDARGLPSTVQFNACLYGANPPWGAVINERNVAGLVTKRSSMQGGGPFTKVESTWTYDKLGRVDSQTIQKGAPLTQVAKQQLTYFGNDDPKTLNHWLGATNQKRFNFTYDLRHQLTKVTENLLPNAFTATYAYSTAGRFKSANVAAAALPNSDVKARNVTYVYGGTDPEQVTKLKKANDATYASYTYDVPGNQLTRAYPDTKERWDYAYDGSNQLRRVTKKVNNVVKGSEEYWYDHSGARELVVKRDASGAKTEMIWFIGDTEAHYDATGTPTQVYAHVSLGTPIARLDRSADAAANVEYQFHGMSSNTLATVDNATGAINASFAYAPFGEIVEATDGGGNAAGLAKHRRRMNDKYVDELSDLAYYGFRYYDNRSMIWTQSDPRYRFMPDAAWMEPRRGNLYSFSANNPLRFLDPDGKDWKDIAAGIAVGAMDVVSFGQYSDKMLPALVEDGTMEYAESSPEFNAAKGATEMVGGIAMAATGLGAARSGLRAAFAAEGLSASISVSGVMAAARGTVSAAAAAEVVAGATVASIGLASMERSYQTYTKTNAKTGEVYTGRTSGSGTPKKNVEARDRNHHMTKKGFGKAQLDKSSTSKKAIRGREQMKIDKHGGAKSSGGTSGNAINGVSPTNPKLDQYIQAAMALFGKA